VEEESGAELIATDRAGSVPYMFLTEQIIFINLIRTNLYPSYFDHQTKCKL
jgi:hypothetical protein